MEATNKLFFPSFTTAGGKTVTVSSKAVVEAKSKFSFDDMLEDECSEANNFNEKLAIGEAELGTVKKSSFPSFSTAGGKTVPVSSKALEEAKLKMSFKNITEGESDTSPPQSPIFNKTVTNLASEVKSVNKSFFPSFSTAGGKTVTVSSKAVAEAKSKFLFEAMSEDESSMNSEMNIYNQKLAFGNSEMGTVNKMPFPSFSTAGGKTVTVSSKALAQAKSKLSFDSMEENDSCSMNAESYGFNEKVATKGIDVGTTDKSPFPSFTTAGGRTVTVSSKALDEAKSKMGFENISEGESDDSPPQSPVFIKKVTNLATNIESVIEKPFVASFSTAGGKAVTVSSKAVAKAKSKFSFDMSAEESPMNSDTNNLKQKLTTGESELRTVDKSLFPSFSTAGGKTVTISSKALEEAKSKFSFDSMSEDESSMNSETNNLKQTVTAENSEVGTADKSPFPCFSTAGGTTVTVSSKALEEAKCRTAVENISEDESDSSPGSPIFNSQPTINMTSDVFDVGQTSLLSTEEAMDVAEISRICLEDAMTSDEDSEWSAAISKGSSNELASIKIGAGNITMLKVAVARIYPVLYAGPSEEGYKLYLNENALRNREIVSSLKKEQLREKLLPEIGQKVRQQLVPKPFKGSLHRSNMESLSTDDLLGFIYSSDDASALDVVNLLSMTKQRELQEARIKLEDKIRVAVEKEILEKLKDHGLSSSISPILKVRIMDVAPFVSNDKLARNAVLSIWNPQEDLINSMKEANVYHFHNLKSTNNQYNSIVRLSTTKESRFEATDLALISSFYARKHTQISEILQQPEEFKPPFEEFDTVGKIVDIENYSENVGQIIYLADKNKNVLKVKFWNSIKASGFEDVIKVDNVVACYNLQWRLTSGKTKTAFVQDVSLFLLQRKSDHLMRAFEEFIEIQRKETPQSSAYPEERKPEDLSMGRMSSKRRYLEQYDNPPDLPSITNPGPPKRRRFSNSKFNPPRRINPKE